MYVGLCIYLLLHPHTQIYIRLSARIINRCTCPCSIFAHMYILSRGQSWGDPASERGRRPSSPGAPRNTGGGLWLGPWACALPAPRAARPICLLGKDPSRSGATRPAWTRRRGCWLEGMEACISIASGKRPISHSGFELQASSPSCVARWAGHSPQLSALSPFLAAKTTPALSQTGLSA